MKLNLGCGHDLKKDYINIDKNNPKANYQLDLNKLPLPFKDNSCTEILMEDFLEHLENPIDFLKECYRLLKLKGQIKIRLPHFSNYRAYDPLHKTYWHATYFSRFCSDNKKGSAEQYILFSIKKNKIHFYKGLIFWNYIIEPLVNINLTTQTIYESLFCWIFPADWIEIVLEKDHNH